MCELGVMLARQPAKQPAMPENAKAGAMEERLGARGCLEEGDDLHEQAARIVIF
jgi:hypothetical protein